MGDVDKSLMRYNEVDSRLKTLEQSGGGGNDGGMNMWQASVENRLSQLHADIRDHKSATDRHFRILFGAIISVALGLAGLMAKGFGWF